MSDKFGKIGIFAPGQNGDVITATAVLKYRDELWPGKDIVWFCNAPCNDALKHQDVEIREYPWQSPEVDFNTNGMKGENNRLSQTRKLDFDITRDLDDGYFPLPWMRPAGFLQDLEYPLISKKIFGIPDHYSWHPCLAFSDDEKGKAANFMSFLPKRKTIMLETFAGSGQSGWNDDLTHETIKVCREIFDECNFIFASHIDHDRFLYYLGGFASCSGFTVRETALIHDYCDLFIGVSSGISVATSHWGANPVPKIQYCNHHICSTVPIARGPIELIAPNHYENQVGPEEKHRLLKQRFVNVLRKTLKQI
jgi:hypothetical protein